MRVDLFDFELPRERIATEPASPRDAARLLHVTRDRLQDKTIRSLPELLRAGDALVLNDTRVIPARLFAMRGEAKIEILLHKDLGEGRWQVFAKPAKKLKPGDVITFSDTLDAQVETKLDSGEVILIFNKLGDEFKAMLLALGEPPLPPYIERPAGATKQDVDDYQTCYATRDGSVAAPTAGLHFTPALLDAIETKGISIEKVTLHVGAGTFQPVKVDDTEQHVMHTEWGEVTAEVVERLNEVKAAGGRVISVGTTSLRLLESAADEQGVLHPFMQDTGIFITPGYRFRYVDCLLTNFHLPKSTLFMLVSAFSGLEVMQAAYRHAIDSGYRFYSYGDACFLERGTRA